MSTLTSVKLRPNLKAKLRAVLFGIVCCCLVAEGGKSFAQGTLSIDLIQGSFAGKSLTSLTLDDVTSNLGSPSASDKLPELVGVRLYYYELGLTFLFRTEPKKRFLLMDLYLTNTLDSPRRMFFAPYLGMLVPSVNSNSTVEQTLDELKKQTSPNQISVKKGYRKLGVKGQLTPVDLVDFKGNSGNVRFFHDQGTRLLEQISAANPG